MVLVDSLDDGAGNLEPHLREMLKRFHNWKDSLGCGWRFSVFRVTVLAKKPLQDHLCDSICTVCTGTKSGVGHFP